MLDHDLVALWEAHCRYEFETRDVDATMATMVAEPYVKHLPMMTGGAKMARAEKQARYSRDAIRAYLPKTSPNASAVRPTVWVDN